MFFNKAGAENMHLKRVKGNCSALTRFHNVNLTLIQLYKFCF